MNIEEKLQGIVKQLHEKPVMIFVGSGENPPAAVVTATGLKLLVEVLAQHAREALDDFDINSPEVEHIIRWWNSGEASMRKRASSEEALEKDLQALQVVVPFLKEVGLAELREIREHVNACGIPWSMRNSTYHMQRLMRLDSRIQKVGYGLYTYFQEMDGE